jgi:hypothetical protein
LWVRAVRGVLVVEGKRLAKEKEKARGNGGVWRV